MDHRTAPVTALAALAVLSWQQPAHAACPPAGTVHLVVRVSAPVLTDYLALVYSVTVTNSGPSTATGLRLRRVSRYCATPTTPVAECVPLPSEEVTPNDLPPGGSATFLSAVPLAVTEPQTVRTTVEVVHVDQPDVASAPGTCMEGARPQDDCDTNATTLR